MKVIDISRGKNRIERELEAFRKTLQVEDFLNAIEYCLANKIDDCSLLEAEWEAQQQNILFDNGMECFSKLLAKIKVEYSPVERVIAETKSFDSDLMKYIEEFTKEEEERKLYNDKYSWFYPSFMIRNLLPGIYPDDIDPGQIIAKNLSYFFPENLPDIFSDGGFNNNSKEYIIFYSSKLYALLKRVSQEIVVASYPDEIINMAMLRGCLDILDPQNKECRKNIANYDAIKLLINIIFLAPKEFFYTWHDAMIEQLHDLDTADDFRTIFSTLALQMFSFGKNNLSIMGEDSKANESEENENNIAFWEHVATQKYLHFNDMFEWFYIYIAIAMNSGEELKTITNRLISNLSLYRRKYLAGIFPADPIYCGRIAGELAELVGYEAADLFLMLREGDFETVLCLFPTDKEQPYQERVEQLEKSECYYLTVFEKSLTEGLPELGVALLSIYILLRAAIEKGRFGNFPQLMPAIEKALNLPGAKTLKHTLAFVVDSVDRYFSNDPIAACSAMYFRPYVPKQAELKSIDGTGGASPFKRTNSESDITAFFIKELGSERWNKLSENSRSCLVSAELQWRNSAIEFGFGIKDWSGLITTYCKAIEGELIEHLQDFYNSSEYGTHLQQKGIKRPQHITGGWLLNMLKNSDMFAPALQKKLAEVNIAFTKDKAFINQLLDIIQNYRNISAHHNAVSMKQFAEFKEKMFQSGLLQKFIDGLPG